MDWLVVAQLIRTDVVVRSVRYGARVRSIAAPGSEANAAEAGTTQASVNAAEPVSAATRDRTAARTLPVTDGLLAWPSDSGAWEDVQDAADSRLAEAPEPVGEGRSRRLPR